MTHGRKARLRWMLAAVTLGALMGGMASAEPPECIRVYACGCSSDGGYVYCSEYC